MHRTRGRTLVGSRNTFFSTTGGYYGGYYGGRIRSSWRGDTANRETRRSRYVFSATTKPLLLPASSPYPYQIDLNELITTTAPAVFNLLEVNEDSISALSEPWNPDDPFATLDENGILHYSPRGTWLNNVLTLKVEIADPYHPPTPIARAASVIYGSISEVPIQGTQEPITEELAIQLVNDILGEDDAGGQFWANQRFNGTCVIGATSSAMASLGIEDADGNPITYERVIRDFVQVVDGQGNVIKEPKFTYANGEPVYRGFFPVMNWASLDPAKQQMYLEQLDNPLFIENRLRKINPTGYNWSRIMNDPNEPDFSDVTVDRSRNVYQLIFDAYKVPSRRGHAIDFVDLIRELEAGNKIAACVDATELWNARRLRTTITTAQERADLHRQGLNSKTNHGVWITGINLADPENPEIIINDTGQRDGAGVRYPLKEFLAAWEDAEFEYIATGEKSITPEMSYRNQHNGLHKTLMTAVFNLRFDDRINEKTYADLSQSTVYNILEKDRAKQVLQQAEKDNPGFTKELENFLEAGQADREYFLEKYGIDPETVKKIITEVDIE